MVTLLLVRHGEAEGNPEHRFIGQTDVPLTRRGKDQVRALTDRLRRLPIARVVSSDLARCVGTVAPTAESLGLEVTTDPRLREVDNGQWNGLLAEEIADRWPEMYERYHAGEDLLRPDGENWAAVADRVGQAIDEIVSFSGDDDEVILIGSHAGPIMATTLRATGGAGGNVFAGPFGSVDHCSLTVLGGSHLQLLAFNDTGHTTQPSWLSLGRW